MNSPGKPGPLTNLNSAPWPLSPDQTANQDDVPLTLGDLPDEIVIHVFRFVDPRQLTRARGVCKLWRSLAVEPMLWRNFFESKYNSGARLTPDSRRPSAAGSDTGAASSSKAGPSRSYPSANPGPSGSLKARAAEPAGHGPAGGGGAIIVSPEGAVQPRHPGIDCRPNDWRPAFCELECTWERAGGEVNLIREGLAASTTDHTSQNINMTLQRSHEHFWSSTGSGPDVDEWVLYRLSSRMALPRAVQIFFYQAAWQRGNPLYVSRCVRISFGYTQKYFHYVSPLFQVEDTDQMQEFPVAPPLVSGGYMKIELIGKKVKQPEDSLYYTVLNCVRCVGLDPEQTFHHNSRVPGGAVVLPALARAAAAYEAFWAAIDSKNHAALRSVLAEEGCRAATIDELRGGLVSWAACGSGAKLRRPANIEPESLASGSHPAGQDPGGFGRLIREIIETGLMERRPEHLLIMLDQLNRELDNYIQRDPTLAPVLAESRVTVTRLLTRASEASEAANRARRAGQAPVVLDGSDSGEEEEEGTDSEIDD